MGVPTVNREKRELAEELGKLPSLSAVGKADLEALAGAGDVVNLPDAWAFVHEGTPADAAYVLLSGEANVMMGRTIVASLAAGAIIGEMAYVDGGQRHATVSTHGRVRAMRVDYEALTPVLEERPALRDVLRAIDRARRTAE
jgi:CRP/FNR family cyclic AMP-dependent transcriptional regulator